MKVTILAFGSLSEPFWSDAVSEYVKRLSRISPLTIIQLPESRLPNNPSSGEIRAALSREAALMLPKIPPRAYVAALCIEGKLLSSEELSAQMDRAALGGYSEFCFLIGSSYGLDDSVKDRADLKLSFSRMTFPHQLARVMLCEQIYRAAQISRGSAYHK